MEAAIQPGTAADNHNFLIGFILVIIFLYRHADIGHFSFLLLRFYFYYQLWFSTNRPEPLVSCAVVYCQLFPEWRTASMALWRGRADAMLKKFCEQGEFARAMTKPVMKIWLNSLLMMAKC